MSQYDVAVIGGGAAGLSAALVLSRARRKVLVVDAGTPRNAPATHMYGYLSRDGLPRAHRRAPQDRVDPWPEASLGAWESRGERRQLRDDAETAHAPADRAGLGKIIISI